MTTFFGYAISLQKVIKGFFIEMCAAGCIAPRKDIICKLMEKACHSVILQIQESLPKDGLTLFKPGFFTALPRQALAT